MRPTAASFLPPHLRGRSSPMGAGAPDTPGNVMRERRPHLSESFVRATEDGGIREERVARLTQLLEAIPTDMVSSTMPSQMQSPVSPIDSPLSERCHALNRKYSKLRDAVHSLDHEEEEVDVELESEMRYIDAQTQVIGMNDYNNNTKEEMNKLGSILLDHDASLVQLTEHVKTHELENQHLLQQVRNLTVSSEKNAAMLRFFKNGLADLLSGMDTTHTGLTSTDDDTLVGGSSPAKDSIRDHSATDKQGPNDKEDFFLQKFTELDYENLLDHVQVLSEKFKKMEGRFNTQKLDLDAIDLKATGNVLEQQIPILYQRLEELAAQIAKADCFPGPELDSHKASTTGVEELAAQMKKLELKASTIGTMSTANEEDLAVRINNLEIKVATLVKKNCHPSYPDN